jgi:hypothetical protein
MTGVHRPMRLTVIGAGYLGLGQAVYMAHLGHQVLLIDADQAKIARLTSPEMSLPGPGLEPLLAKNLEVGRLRFTSSYEEAAEFGEVHFLCVGPPDVSESILALEDIFAAADALAPHLRSRCLVVGKSAAPVGTARKLLGRIRAAAPAGGHVDLAWNPEFLCRGPATQGTSGPEFLIFGVTSDWAEELLRQIYGSPLAAGIPSLVVDPETAEMVKASTRECGHIPPDVVAHEAAGGSLVGGKPVLRDVARRLRHAFPQAAGQDSLGFLDTEDEAGSAHDLVTISSPSCVAGQRYSKVELTVVMPCLNEAETVATCVRKAVTFLEEYHISGEVIVADNGSTDGSQQLAQGAGARVVSIEERGYGNALLGGIKAARGQYVIMGDADDSYDFTTLMPFVDRLRDGADLVMGNRFQGGIARNAMPALHRYLGNPVLSFIGRLFFRSKIGDFHCGLRGFRKDSTLTLSLQASGMEFASEMVVKATLAGQRIEEVPTTLSPDGRSRPPHLRSWTDGWRHLRFLLLFSPRWLFLIPGAVLCALGLVTGVAATSTSLRLGTITFNTNSLACASAMMVIGFQSVLFGLFTQIYASEEGFLPPGSLIKRLLTVWNLERTLAIGGFLALVGMVGLVISFAPWHNVAFAHSNHESLSRLVVFSVTALILSCQLILGAFFLSILGIRRTRQAGAVGVSNGIYIRSADAQPTVASASLAESIYALEFPNELADA